MNTNLKALASLVLVSALTVGHAQTTASTTGTSTRKKKTTAHKTVPARPSVESQIESLRNDLNSQRGQIDSLKQQLSDRDSQLQQAQQAAAAAQAAAQQAQQAAQAQQQTLADNSQAVSSLQGAVSDLKTNTQSLVTTVQDQQAQVKKSIENPDAIHFKGITLSPTGSFIAAETVYRNRAIGADVNTPFTSVPLTNADAAHTSEFFGSGRQSRIALLAEGKLDNFTMRGYYEADWLGVGVTSNNNQSNSYVMRQRQIWAQAERGPFTFTGGQMWSLATETKQGMTNRSEALPQTIDAQYTAGFVWERQYGARAVMNFSNKFWVGIAAENPQTLAPSCAASTGASCPTNYFIGSAGANGGLYNGGGAPGATSSANLANYSFNLAPDLIAKVAAEPGWGHYEVFGIARFFRNRIYPNDVSSVAKPNSSGAYNDSTVGGGIGGSLRVPTLKKHLDVGIKGLWGDGISRYGTSTLPDLTLRPDAQLALLHGFSALGTLELHATPRLDFYANYGGDYVGRHYFVNGSGTSGYGSPLLVNTGCGTEPIPTSPAPTNGFAPAAPGSCAAVNKDVQEFTFGDWYDFYKGPKGRMRFGLQYSYVQRNTWSGVGGNPKGIDDMFFSSFRYYMP
jgi:hypothetical protein